VRLFEVGKTKLKMTIWDTAGQDRFQNITTTYYKGAHGVILMYSIADRKSFENIKTWMKMVDENSDPDIGKIIIGNKCDLSATDRKV
jgi:small GTP-binding protein